MRRSESLEKQTRIAYACLAAGLLLTGCATKHPTPNQTTPSHGDVTMGLDAQDLMVASDAAVPSLLESGIFDRATRRPAMLGIGRFENRTSGSFDMDLLTGQIRSALLETGKVVVVERGHNATDSSSQADALSRPDFTLSGKVIESRARTGSVNQSTYIFQFSLTDSNNLTVWAKEQEISKFTRRNPGF